jgi:PAS domain S-box-containing protein
MQWLTNPFVLPMILAGLIALICAFFVLQRDKVPGSTPLLGLILAVFVWATAYAFELASPQLYLQVFWAKVEYLGIPLVPMFMFIFAYELSQASKKLTRRDLILLGIPPVIFAVLAWTNDYHGWIWSQLGQKNMGSYYLLVLEHGFAFWFVIAYSYILLFSGTIIIVRRYNSSPAEFKSQSLIVLAGAGITWLGNIIYISKVSPFPELDFTPISFVISGIIFSIGLFRFGILDIMPIAGEAVLESLDDIVIVLNAKDRVVFVNGSFEYYFRVSPSVLIGKNATSAFSPWPSIGVLVDHNSTIRKEITVVSADKNAFIFSVQVFNIRWRAEQILGRVIILSDITERRSAESRVAQKQLQEVGSPDIPLTVTYRLIDEKVVDVNRTFLTNLGHERKNVLGRSLLELGFWDSYQRTDFLRALFKEGKLSDYTLRIRSSSGEKKAYFLSASHMEIQGVKYVVIFAQESSERN